MRKTMLQSRLGVPALGLAALLAAGCAVMGPPGPDFRAAVRKASESREARAAFVDLAVDHARQANALRLFQAADHAMALNRLEDAAFLFFAGQMRAQLDVYTYRSEQNRASRALDMLGGALSPDINPAILRNPEAYAAVVDRLEHWQLLPERGYDPGWEYPERRPREKQRERAAQIKERELTHMRQIADLLSDPEYFEAFLTVQAYQLAPEDSRRNPNLLAAKVEAERTLRRIEREKGYDISAGGRR